MVDLYKDAGYESRYDYLRSLADEFGVSFRVVDTIADMLGPNEDFDGLLIELEDYSEMYDGEEDEDE